MENHQEKKLTHKMKTLLLQVPRNAMLHIKVGNTKPKHASDALSRSKLLRKSRYSSFGYM